MSTVTVTAENFEETILGDGIVLLDWWASWCGPCMQFGPVFEAASDKHQDITFAKIDTDAEQQLAAGAQIMSIPTLMAFRDGILVFNQAGSLPPAALEDLIKAVRDLDMDEVRASAQPA
jgi:thioredoxin 1